MNLDQNIDKTIDNKNCGFVFGNILLRKRLKFNNNININLNQYKCIECQFESNCLQIFKEHQLKHKIKCQSKTSDNQYLLRAHEKNIQRNNDNNNKDLNSIQNELICDKCKQVFECNQSLIEHKNNFHNSLVYKCNECFERSFSTKSRFINHLKLVHNKYEEKQIKCNECEQCFSTLSHLIQHKNKLHSEPQPIVEMCDWPQTQVETESVSVNNNKSFNSNKSEEKLFECKKCKMFLKSSSKLSQHMIKSHLKSNVGPVEKPVTQTKTRSQSKLKKHENSVQLIPQKDFFCDECSLHFKRKFNFESHKRFHDSIKNLKFKCNNCEFVCNNPQDLKEHQKKHTFNRVKCVSKGCEQTFVNKYIMKIHVNKFHFEYREYCCDFAECHLNFKTKKLLNEHLLTHEKELIIDNIKSETLDNKESLFFMCGQKDCELRFSSGSELRAHYAFHRKFDSIKS